MRRSFRPTFEHCPKRPARWARSKRTALNIEASNPNFPTMDTDESYGSLNREPLRNHFLRLPFRLSFPALLMLTAFALLANPQMVQAGRLVDFEIRLDGKLALSGFLIDEGIAAPDAVWEYLKTLDFTLPHNRQFGTKGGYSEGFVVKPDEKDPLSATLTGKLQIACRYGGGVVEVTSLKLIRKTISSEKWQLAPEEIERTFKLRKPNPGVKSQK